MKKYNRSGKLRPVLAASISMLALGAGLNALPAMAQDATAPAAAPADETVVVVTGSRLSNRGFKAPTPVTVLDQQELKLSGTQTVAVMLSDTPQFTGSQLNSPTANTVQAGQPVGTATLNLRNFGPTRNLVLVNGRRFAITGPDFTTDINTAASLHFLCAIENALVMEYCVEPGEISRALAKKPVTIRDGYAHLPSEPGLGVVTAGGL